MADSDSDDAPLKPKVASVKVEHPPKKAKAGTKQEDNDDEPLVAKAQPKSAPASKTAVKAEDSDEEPLVQKAKTSTKAAAPTKKATPVKKPTKGSAAASAKKSKGGEKVKGGVKKAAAKGKGKGSKGDKDKAKAKAKTKTKRASKGTRACSAALFARCAIVILSTGKDDAKPKKVEEVQHVFKWWEEKVTLPEGHKWQHLEHNGCMFPPEYTSHGQKMLYQGQPVSLNLEQEEVATM